MASGIRSRVEAARVYAGISSQAELATLIDMSTMTFKRRLAGDYPFKRGELLAIAEVCQVPIWFLERGFDVEILKDDVHQANPNDAIALADQLRQPGRKAR